MQVWAHNNFCSVCAWSIIFASIDKQVTCFESTLIIQEDIYHSNHYLYSCKKWCELDSLFCCSLLGYLLSREPHPRGKLWATRARGCVRKSRRAASSVENAGRAARLRCSARVARFTSVTSEGRHRLFLMSLLALQNISQKMQNFRGIWKSERRQLVEWGWRKTVTSVRSSSSRPNCGRRETASDKNYFFR